MSKRPAGAGGPKGEGGGESPPKIVKIDDPEKLQPTSTKRPTTAIGILERFFEISREETKEIE